MACPITVHDVHAHSKARIFPEMHTAFTHSSHADNVGSTMWCFLGLHITGASRLQSPCKRSWRLPRLNSVELMRLGPQQNHAGILSSKSTACSFRNGRHEHSGRCARSHVHDQSVWMARFKLPERDGLRSQVMTAMIDRQIRCCQQPLVASFEVHWPPPPPPPPRPPPVVAVVVVVATAATAMW